MYDQNIFICSCELSIKSITGLIQANMSKFKDFSRNS